MRAKTDIKNKNVVTNQRVRRSSRDKSEVVKKTATSHVYANLAGEGHEDFYNYLDWLGLAKNPHLLILTSTHHYYFEVEDLRNIKTIVNLNKLNNIRGIKDFLQAIYSVMPDKCYFVGSFTGNKKHGGFLHSKDFKERVEWQVSGSHPDTNPWSTLLHRVYDIIDLNTNRYMPEKNVRILLEDTGLKILDITEFNGLTYFCTQKDNPSVE